MEVSTPKTEGKLLHHAQSFPSVFGVDTSINQKNISMIPEMKGIIYHLLKTESFVHGKKSNITHDTY